jgi:hypothetical protein
MKTEFLSEALVMKSLARRERRLEIAEDRITAVGNGEAGASGSSDDADNASDRRVDIKVTQSIQECTNPECCGR